MLQVGCLFCRLGQPHNQTFDFNIFLLKPLLKYFQLVDAARQYPNLLVLLVELGLQHFGLLDKLLLLFLFTLNHLVPLLYFLLQLYYFLF